MDNRDDAMCAGCGVAISRGKRCAGCEIKHHKRIRLLLLIAVMILLLIVAVCTCAIESNASAFWKG